MIWCVCTKYNDQIMVISICNFLKVYPVTESLAIQQTCLRTQCTSLFNSTPQVLKSQLFTTGMVSFLLYSTFLPLGWLLSL